MAKRSVETAWHLLVDGYLPFVRERAGRINPDPAGSSRNRTNPDPGHRHPGGNVTSLDFEIDREGTFTRVRDGA